MEKDEFKKMKSIKEIIWELSTIQRILNEIHPSSQGGLDLWVLQDKSIEDLSKYSDVYNLCKRFCSRIK